MKAEKAKVTPGGILFELGTCHEGGHGTKRDLVKARRYYQRAKAAGFAAADAALARLAGN